jgi:hypothetical protein
MIRPPRALPLFTLRGSLQKRDEEGRSFHSHQYKPVKHQLNSHYYTLYNIVCKAQGKIHAPANYRIFGKFDRRKTFQKFRNKKSPVMRKTQLCCNSLSGMLRFFLEGSQ